MRNKILVSLLCLAPMVADAAIPYRVEQTRTPAETIAAGTTNDDEAFARVRRFYIGGAYNFSMWNDASDDLNSISGKNTTGFEGMVGIRIYDTFRIEANYVRLDAEWDAFKLESNTIMVNAIFDARIDSIYRAFRKQMIVPYLGVGGGVSMNSSDDVKIGNKNTPVIGAMAGIGIEIGDRLTFDIGYRYLYTFTPKFDVIEDVAPTAHQLRGGVRFNF